jgi:hypothetical protein
MYCESSIEGTESVIGDWGCLRTWYGNHALRILCRLVGHGLYNYGSRVEVVTQRISIGQPCSFRTPHQTNAAKKVVIVMI